MVTIAVEVSSSNNSWGCAWTLYVVTETRRDLCYASIRGGQCLNPSGTAVTRSVCCCSLDSMEASGVGWGSPCEPCPSMDTDEYKMLCPHGPGMTNGGVGKCHMSRLQVTCGRVGMCHMSLL